MRRQIQFLGVRDTEVGRQLVIIQTVEGCLIIPSDNDPEELPIRSVGRAIRVWMKEDTDA